ncbi:MAG: 30S ribosomal protein S9 [Bacteroidetes bacterium]|jgi:small subunit ribosomal protein S9|nr:30S ribosomal protein S9 [Bacteroidota bacterium]
MSILNTSGRRKTSIARIYLKKNGKGDFKVNHRDYKEYFPTSTLQYKITQAFEVANENPAAYDLKVNVAGGGINGQAEAIRLALAKALVGENEEIRSDLRTHGLLTRDSRMVERKKFGRKKARRRFQFSKR